MAKHPNHVVIVEPEVFGLAIEVRIEPPISGECLDREFEAIALARRYAMAVAEEHGLLVVDRTGEAVQ